MPDNHDLEELTMMEYLVDRWHEEALEQVSCSEPLSSYLGVSEQEYFTAFPNLENLEPVVRERKPELAHEYDSSLLNTQTV